MLLEMNDRFKHLPNNSAPLGFVWQSYDFDGCAGQERDEYFWAVCTLLCFALGFPASIAILREMVKARRRRMLYTPNDFLILNLSIMDAIFLAFIPFGLLNNFFWKSWPFEACLNAISALNSCGRPLLMACVCLDCYIAVVHPLTYHNRKSLTPRAVAVVIVWVFTVASGILYFLFYKLYFTMFPTVPFITAIVIIGICDSFILHALVKSDPDRNNIHPQKKRAIQTLIHSLVMTVLSYLPPVLMLSARTLLSRAELFTCSAGILMTISSALGATVMPILHLNSRGKFDRFKLGCCRKS